MVDSNVPAGGRHLSSSYSRWMPLFPTRFIYANMSSGVMGWRPNELFSDPLSMTSSSSICDSIAIDGSGGSSLVGATDGLGGFSGAGGGRGGNGGGTSSVALDTSVGGKDTGSAIRSSDGSWFSEFSNIFRSSCVGGKTDGVSGKTWFSTIPVLVSVTLVEDSVLSIKLIVEPLEKQQQQIYVMFLTVSTYIYFSKIAHALTTNKTATEINSQE